MSVTNTPIPPRIPGDSSLKTLELELLKVEDEVIVEGDISCNALTATTTVVAGTTMTAGTGITATTGAITATAGSVVAGTTVTAGTGMTATTGAITATAGSVVGTGHVYSAKAAYTQLTNATTAVPITTSAGTVTTVSLTNATTVSTVFNLTGAVILASSQIMLTPVSYSGTPETNGVPLVFATSVAAGTAAITVSNYGANALSGTVSFNYIIV